MAVQTDRSIRVHCDPTGEIWYGDDYDVAVPSTLSADEFADSPALADIQNVRLIGSIGNAHLIERLYAANHKRKVPYQIQLSGPQTCGGRVPEPARDVLSCLWYTSIHQQLLCPWYAMQRKDYSAYALAAEVHANGVTQKAIEIMRYHPAWPALSFVPTLNPEPACELLSIVLDPRWYRDPERPSRRSRLYTYLGLSDANIKALLYRAKPRHQFEHADVAVSAWLSDGTLADEPKTPKDFLVRVALMHERQHHGVLVATRRFVRFVTAVWEHERSTQELFSVEAFFRYEAEQNAYRAHRAAMEARNNDV